MKKLVLSILTTLFSFNSNSQVQENKQWDKVLKEKRRDTTYIFNNSREDYHDETQLTYLGKIRIVDGRIFQLIKSCWIWGLSKRATGRILFFNPKNQYVGEYYVGGLYDLPEKLINDTLIFLNKDKTDCDKTLETRISFKSGIPKKILVKCKNDLGNIYSFSSD